MKKWIFALVSVALLTFFSGCLGSGGDSGGTDEPTVRGGSLNLTGSHTSLAQINPVETELAVDIPLDYDNVIKITVNITINDGDENTDPDTVGMMTLSEVDGNNSGTANGGSASPGTPFTSSITVEWDGTNYMDKRWNLLIPVTIVAGPDQWIGPFIWRGVPDEGWTYELGINYEFHEEES